MLMVISVCLDFCQISFNMIFLDKKFLICLLLSLVVLTQVFHFLFSGSGNLFILSQTVVVHVYWDHCQCC